MDNSIIAVVIAFVALIGSVVLPAGWLYLAARDSRRDRSEDHARQDTVAKVAAAAVAASLATSEEIKHSLRQIHILVNDNLTVAKQGELNQALMTLVILQRQTEPSDEDVALLVTTKARVAELEAVLADRAGRQKLVDDDNIGGNGKG